MKSKSPNRPQKGDRITVEPIRSMGSIRQIKELLAGNLRNLLLFTMGINNGIRSGDLLRLKVGDVRGKKIGQCIEIRESKTGKNNILMINGSVYSVLVSYLSAERREDDEYLFRSRKGQNAPLTIQSVNRLLKTWCRSVDLEGNYGAHTLRKTFGYIQRTQYGVGFEVLCKRFNHSSPSVTMRYLGINDKEVVDILNNDI